MSFSYSFDEELFHGSFATVGEAIGAARDEADCNGEVAVTVWIGEERHPTEWITAFRLGDRIDELISDWLTDEVGEVAENFALKPEQSAALGQLVLDFIAQHGGFRCWGVKNIQRHSLGEPQRDNKTVDMFGDGA